MHIGVPVCFLPSDLVCSALTLSAVPLRDVDAASSTIPDLQGEEFIFGVHKVYSRLRFSTSFSQHEVHLP